MHVSAAKVASFSASFSDPVMTSLSRRFSVALLMLSVHLLLWMAWQTQTSFKLIRDTPRVYLQLLQIPLPKKLPTPEKFLAPPVATSTAHATTTKKVTVVTATTSTVISAAPTTNTRENPSITTPDTDTQAKPHLDLDALRVAAVAMEKQRRHGEIEKIQDSLKRDDSFEKQLDEGVKKAQAKDCRQAYTGLGLLALIPLAASVVSDKVCKW